MSERNNDGLNFTVDDKTVFDKTVNHEFFGDNDAELIFEALKSGLVKRSFGDYLKRYICRRAELEGDWRDIPLNVYRRIIMESFGDNSTPASFAPTTAKLSALTKNWLTQDTVKRKVVFLLAFGLGMSEEDVSYFLIKVLRERDINPKDPFELICWYCIRNRLGYPKCAQLLEQFESLKPDEMLREDIFGERTVSIRNLYSHINDDDSLMAQLSKMKSADNQSLFSVTARDYFDKLYSEAKKVIADIYNSDWSNEKGKAYTAEDITAGDVERMLCSIVPRDKNGNLTKLSLSEHTAGFSDRRFSRQHISEILNGNCDIDRFDLITLEFFIYSQKLDEYPDPKQRFLKFTDSINAILNECSMGELIISNTYECFVMMCMLSDDPLCTYSDVWEMSREED